VHYDYDNADRLIRVTDWLDSITTYTYDLAGSLVRTTLPDGSVTTYGYDNGSRLTSIVDAKADGSLNAVYKYTLDALSNRRPLPSINPLLLPLRRNWKYHRDD